MTKPAVTGTTHPLPFDRLSADDFERLCLWLLEREGFEHVQHLGAAGKDRGWDVIGDWPVDGSHELWVFQCKRYKKINASQLKSEVEKCSLRGVDARGRQPARVVFVTSCNVSDSVRTEVISYAATKGLECEFWAKTELDMRVNKHPSLVWYFFSPLLPPMLPSLPFSDSWPEWLAALTPAPHLPFNRSPILGRERTLEQLEMLLMKATGGKAIVGLTGMAGSGKTHLAVEFAYRQQDRYPGGVFWIDAAGSMRGGVAAIGRSILEFWDSTRPEGTQGVPLVKLVWLAHIYLQQRADALLILDDVADPALLEQPETSGLVLSRLGCQVIFTTRKRNLKRYGEVEVKVLDLDEALELLLRGEERAPAQHPGHAEHKTACRICELLGRLPLALEIAGSFLRNWPDLSLAEFETRLRVDGGLETVDQEAQELEGFDGPMVHDHRVKAAFQMQFAALGDATAERLLKVAGQLAPGTVIPAARLGLLAGVLDAGRPGNPSPLRRALRRLCDSSLARESLGDQVNLHPLIREFAAQLIAPEERPHFCRRCVANLADAFENLVRLEEQCARRGIERLQEDLLVGLSLLSVPGHEDAELDRRLQSLLRVMSRECNTLQSWRPEEQPAALAQQLHYRATCLGLPDLSARAATRLNDLGGAWLALRWAAGRTLPALERTVAAHQGPVRGVAVLPGEWQVVSGADDGMLKLWNLGTALPGPSLGDIGRPVTAIAAARDSGRVVAGDSAGGLWAWDRPASGADLPACWQFGELGTRVWSLAITADGRRAVSGDGNGKVKLWNLSGDPEQGQAWTLGEHGRRVLALTLLEGGACVASGSFDGTLKLWVETEPDRWQEWSAVRGRSPVQAMAGPPDGSWLIVGAADGSAEVWKVTSSGLESVTSLPGRRDGVTSLAVAPDGRRAILGSRDGSLRVWDPDTRERPGERILVEYGRGITSVAVTPDGLRAISGDSDGMLRVWDLSTGPEAGLRVIPGHGDWVLAVTAVGIDGEVASGGGDGLVKLWNLPQGMGNSGDVSQVLTVSGPVSALAATPDGRWLAVGTEGRTLELWDLSIRNHPVRVAHCTAHGNTITALAMDADCRIVSAGNDGLIRVWCSSGREKPSLAGHTVGRIPPGINGLDLVPGGRFAIAGADDGRVLAWELVAEGECPAITMGQHDGLRVHAVAVTADCLWAASGDEKGVIRLWNIADLPERVQVAETLTGHAGAVYALCGGHEAGELLSGGADGTLRLWVPGQEGASWMSHHVQQAAVSVEAPVRAVTVVPGGLVVAGDALGTVHCFHVVRPGDAPGRRTGDGT